MRVKYVILAPKYQIIKRGGFFFNTLYLVSVLLLVPYRYRYQYRYHYRYGCLSSIGMNHLPSIGIGMDFSLVSVEHYLGDTVVSVHFMILQITI